MFGINFTPRRQTQGGFSRRGQLQNPVVTVTPAERWCAALPSTGGLPTPPFPRRASSPEGPALQIPVKLAELALADIAAGRQRVEPAR
jgi:hypothetical protein